MWEKVKPGLDQEPWSGEKLEWTPGTPGKGFVDRYGDLHTWTVDPTGATPHHQEVAQARNVKKIQAFFDIRPNGDIIDEEDFAGEPVSDEALAQDPRLHKVPSWQFDRVIPEGRWSFQTS